MQSWAHRRKSALRPKRSNRANRSRCLARFSYSSGRSERTSQRSAANAARWSAVGTPDDGCGPNTRLLHLHTEGERKRMRVESLKEKKKRHPLESFANSSCSLSVRFSRFQLRAP